MAETPSTMIPLGTHASDFNLKDVITNQMISLHTLSIDKGVVIMFICNHCPYVKLILPTLITIAQEYQAKGIQFIAINSNDVTHYPDDHPDKMKLLAQQLQFPFPYLFDETQTIAKAYHAACTPDFFVFDQQLKCVYRGRFDDATPGNKKIVTGTDLKNALDYLIGNKGIFEPQIPSVGCNIKWKK